MGGKVYLVSAVLFYVSLLLAAHQLLNIALYFVYVDLVTPACMTVT